MRNPQAKGREWLTRNYEKLILLALFFLILACSAWLGLQLQQRQDALQNAVGTTYNQAPVLKVDLAAWNQRRAEAAAVFQGGSYTNDLLVSEMRVACIQCGRPIPYLAMACAFCGTAQPAIADPAAKDTDGDGMPDKKEREVGLNPEDARDAGLDLDQDGFTNIEEYREQTRINHAEDFPSPAARLRVGKIVSQPFILRFMGVQKLSDDSLLFQLNLRRDTLWGRLNKPVEVNVPGKKKEIYEIIKFEPKTVMEKGRAVDKSVLTLKKDQEIIPLIINEIQSRHERIALLLYLIDRSKYTVRINDTFHIEKPASDYKVIDIQEKDVRIRDAKSGKETVVPIITREEWAEFQGAPAAVDPVPSTSPVPAQPAPAGAGADALSDFFK